MNNQPTFRQILQKPEYAFRHYSDVNLVPPQPLFAPLTNGIHPVWQYMNWRNVQHEPGQWTLDRVYESSRYDYSEEQFQRLFPALQLATLLLYRAAPFFVHIMRAPIIWHDGSLDPVLDQDWVPTTADYLATEQLLLQLGARSRIMVNTADVPEYDGGPTADMLAFTETELSHSYHFLARPIVVVVILELLAEIMEDSWSTKAPLQRATIWLNLAVVLVHELGHEAWQERTRGDVRLLDQIEARRRGELTIPEPMMPPENFAEVGESVTRFLLGCRTQLPLVAYLTRWEIAAGITQATERLSLDGTLGMFVSFYAMDITNHPDPIRCLGSDMIFNFFNKNYWYTDGQMKKKVTIDTVPADPYPIQPHNVDMFPCPHPMFQHRPVPLHEDSTM